MRDVAFDRVMVNTPNHALERTGQQRAIGYPPRYARRLPLNASVSSLSPAPRSNIKD